ncbi:MULTISPECIES: TetR-like C-terminal domain-containing protein [Streptomyces]|uniref:Transcriptional regulator n=1 Tax=Streptomyces sviceus (strain ATCC 29083 / DSM 924 / JCM 4929 / NBRC 13980 / NCIMB 11184 / NRRL 5439 / UC 5370) TaxID=463191 RepID=B5HUR5_STRX2|nr:MULTISPECIES: TetR-like C-terminal domain-containing protein [Streptomyces]EDY56570.1 transcriptional regulator [Streptomyces sviceus ATCC 29083]MYT10716.1 TetR family transcriptional regulator [Streptomyces sp. SID5470]
MAGRAKLDDVPERLVRATVDLLAEQGPSAIKARSVASASGLSTMVVYSHFGGIPELMSAVADHGFKELGRAFALVPVTEDPIADLFAMALTCRRLASDNPHLYDLMFGLSTRATYRPSTGANPRLSGHSPAFREAHVHITAACERLVHSGRVEQREPEVMAAQLWSMVHGYITLELAEHFVEFEDAVAQVLLPMGVNFAVGLGDQRTRAEVSHQAGARLYGSITEGH